MIVVCGAFVGPAWASAPKPAPAPAIFTTENYNLTARVPGGLFHCPYPEGWVGSDHGIAIYLSRPKACDPRGPAAADGEAERLPRITIFYAFNTAEDIEGPDGDFHSPRDKAELTAKECRRPSGPLPAGITLLGSPAAGCVHWRGDAVSVVIGAVYDQGPATDGGSPGSFVFVGLETSRGRYDRDFWTFRTIAASLRVCAGFPPCPPFTQW